MLPYLALMLAGLAALPIAQAADPACAASRAAVSSQSPASAHYAAAVCAARGADGDALFAFLDAAAAMGFRNMQAILSDPAFKPFRQDQRWQGAVQKN